MATRLVRDLATPFGLKPPVAVAVGSFDGLHLGHRRLIEIGRDECRSGSLAVLSFHPHPAVVLGYTQSVPPITTLRQKLRVFSSWGVDLLVLMRFSAETAKFGAADFLERVVVGALQADCLIAGPDAAVGKGRQGNAAFIADFLAKTGRRLRVVDFCMEQGLKISSRVIREMIVQGEIARAGGLLGRPFALEGRVVCGDRRGRCLGFPTANLSVPRQVVPASGVYACRVILGARHYLGVANLGIRPTFGGTARSVEVHLPEYVGAEFYGARIELQFLERLRGEKKFSTVAELREQISRDLEAARCIFKG